jgi:hypothetical protein
VPRNKLKCLRFNLYAVFKMVDYNVAALAAGLTVGAFYRTGYLLKVVH